MHGVFVMAVGRSEARTYQQQPMEQEMKSAIPFTVDNRMIEWLGHNWSRTMSMTVIVVI